MKGSDVKSKELINRIKMTFPSLSLNESMARAAVAAFCSQLNPEVSEIADIKCAVSEAVTNCTVHAYKGTVGSITVTVRLYSDRSVSITVADRGCGIADVREARKPLFTTGAQDERSGMGFTVMESFMDKVNVRSGLGRGTTVTMLKHLSPLTHL